MRSTCRVCGHAFFPEPLLRYDNMPAMAQFLPGKRDLARDKGIALEACQCAGCGLVQLSSPAVPYYREVVRAAAFSEEMRAFRRRQFADWIAAHSLQAKKILEVGCGRGEYLALLADAGAQAQGLEHSQPAVDDCRARGLNVARGFIEGEAYPVPGAPFDAFAILNFLEHVPKPNALLRGIAHNLVPGGMGLVEVPNFDMILEKNLFSEFMTDHLFYFTRDTLVRTLEFNGFEVLDATPLWHDYVLAATVRKRSALDLTRFTSQQREIRDQVYRYINKYGDGQVAIWGAGHQALAVINLFGLGARIRYVLDSAPFKQGKYTPASHIPIAAPDRLKEDPVPAVIVMAASYSDEVASIIRRDHGSGVHVAILREHGLEMRE